MASTDLSALRGQRVLITGAARGIGAALAERLASHGARLALVGLEPETMEAVAERCGEGTFVAECDVSSNEQVTQASTQLPRRSAASTSSSPTRGSRPAGRCARRTCARGSG